MLHAFAQSKHLDLSVHIQSALPDCLLGDAIHLQQILINCLNNGQQAHVTHASEMHVYSLPYHLMHLSFRVLVDVCLVWHSHQIHKQRICERDSAPSHCCAGR